MLKCYYIIVYVICNVNTILLELPNHIKTLRGEYIQFIDLRNRVREYKIIIVNFVVV